VSVDHTAQVQPLLRMRTFSELSRRDMAYAGGKGANLGELTWAGVPVPPGFVVGAPVYAAFCDESGLRERIAARLERLDVDDTTALEATCAEVHAMVEAEPVPDRLAQAIVDAYRRVADGDERPAVAVRSSAMAEDIESAALAGVGEAILNVRGAEAVVEAVRRCWASLFGSHRVFYRAKHGFAQAELDIAVIVQHQVASTRAGVMSTSDRSSGRRDRIVIEGAFGLGESVVSGRVSPDRYVVDKATLGTVTREVSRKELAIEPLASGGTTTRELSREEASRPALSDEEMRILADLAVRIEQHYGVPQNTDWAFDGEGWLWMLRSRPLTSAEV
jgi:pyruvate, water dikinase